MARVLVTGASGFVGYHLVQALTSRGDEVTCLVRRTSNLDRLASAEVDLVYGDVTQPKSVAAAVAGRSVVYHVAGCVTSLSRRQMYLVNEEGVRNVARACAEQDLPPVLVVVSSLAAAGPSPPGRLRTETDPINPVSCYGQSKRAGELAAEEYADRVPITIVRPPILLGEADLKGLELFRAIARYRVHLVPGTRPHRFSVLHVADLVQFLLLAARRGRRLKPLLQRNGTPTPTGYYFLAGNEHPTYAELGRMVGIELDRPHAWLVSVPMPIVWGIGTCVETVARIRRRPLYLNFDKIREIAAGSWACSPKRAEEELGYCVSVPLAERLRQTVAWYREEGWL